MPARTYSALCHVTTFYSFKGGVGRSLLLANAGWLLSERQRVLLWDLDIEAPGLHRIPALRPPEVRRGFFEWLAEIKPGEALSDDGSLVEPLEVALRKMVLQVPDRPRLAILPAFSDGADFARLYAEGPWRQLLVDNPDLGLAVFDAVLAVIGERFDHVLIDSRTGITDIGGLLAALLPHATVLVGSYGHQSLHGLLHVKKALEPAAAGRLAPRARLGMGAGLQLVHVVSPVPDDTEDAAERRRIWRDVFQEVNPIEIPFDRRLLWSERLLAAEDTASATARVYREVATRLSELRDLLLHNTEASTAADARYPERAEHADIHRSPSAHGFAFEQRVARLLELHGYSVEPEQIFGDSRIDLVARITVGLDDEQCWWVECKASRQVGREALEALLRSINGTEGQRQGARGMMLARGFSPAAVRFAKDHPKLLLLTIDTLERRLFDPRPYLNALVSQFESGPLSRTYVRQRVLLESRGQEGTVDLLDHAHAWTAGRGSRLWLLLGDSGTGKSTFFQRFAYELAQRALKDPEAPFPIAVDLKEFPNPISPVTLLFEHLRRKVPSFRGNPDALLHLLSSGRCVLLLDAFDEMGAAAIGRTADKQLRELASLTGEDPLETPKGNRVLITCDAHFFRDRQALSRVAHRFAGDIVDLYPFGSEQIRELLEKHLSSVDAQLAEHFITLTGNLLTLAQRPVLLELIIQSRPWFWRKTQANRITPAALYDAYTRTWLEDCQEQHLATPQLLRRDLIGMLTVILWRRAQLQIHLRDLLVDMDPLKKDQVDAQLRTAPFLARSADGYYSFTHRSFLEYFLARYLLDKVKDVGDFAKALDLPQLSPEIGALFWDLAAHESQVCFSILLRLSRETHLPQTRANALRLVEWNLRRANPKATQPELRGNDAKTP